MSERSAIRRSRFIALIMGVASMICLFLLSYSRIQMSEAFKQKDYLSKELELAEKRTQKLQEDLAAVNRALVECQKE